MPISEARLTVQTMLAALALSVLIGPRSRVYADAPKPMPKVIYQFGPGVFDARLPHGVPFQLEVELPSHVSGDTPVSAELWPAENDECTDKRPTGRDNLLVSRGPREGPPVKYVFESGPLKYSRRYCFRAATTTKLSKEEKEKIASALKAVARKISATGGAPADAPTLLAQELGVLANLPVTAGPAGNTLVAQIRQATRTALANYISLNSNVAGFQSNIPLRIQDVLNWPKDTAPFSAHPTELQAYEQALSSLRDDASIRARILAEGVSASDAAVVEAVKVADDLNKAAQALHNKTCTPAALAGTPQPLTDDCRTLVGLTQALKSQVKDLQSALEARDAAEKAIPTDLDSLGVTRWSVQRESSTSSTYTERAALYLAADLGVAMPIFRHGGGVDLALYLAVALYFQPVDKDVPLSVEGGFGKRFSLLFGFTLTNVKDDAGSTSGVLNGKTVLGGAGYRLTDYLRLGVGAVLFRQESGNPTIETTSIRAAPFVSASIDIDVVGIIKGMFEQGAGAAR